MFLKKEHSLIVGCVHSIEGFGIMDGPNIRIVVFLSGCSMKCLYCHNPDVWGPEGDTPMAAEGIPNQYEQACPFHKKEGIMVGGGKSLMQIGSVTELFERTKKGSVYTCLDTSDITFNPGSRAAMARFDRLLASADLILLSIEHIDPKEHVKLCSQPQDNILAFAGYLEKRRIPAQVRHMVVSSITDQEEYLYRLGRYLGTLENVGALDVSPYHGMGKAKYHQLGIPYSLEGTAPLPPIRAVETRRVILQGMCDEETHCF